MKTNTQHWLITVVTTLAAAAFLATSSFAETPNSESEDNTGYMMPGMYGGMGQGYMGQGMMGRGMMGPGMMGQGYMGQGMMGRGMMGPGMMGQGYMGQGMMGPGMMGYGMMGPGSMGMMQSLDMDKAQRSKLRSMMRDQRSANCKTMTEMMDIRDELAAEYDKDVPDAKAIGKLYDKMAGLQKHMLEQSVEMHNTMRGMLNKDQQKKYDSMYHGGMMGNGGMMGYGGMMQ